MQLDQYRIAIRERSYVDILDLALQLTRAHFGKLTAALVVGTVPVALLNAWLLRGATEFYGDWPFPPLYMLKMLALVCWLAPLATAPATLLLGQLLFDPRPEPGRLVLDFLKSLPQLIWYQVVLRPLLFCVTLSLVPLAVWPYINEVILLERNPFGARQNNSMTTQRRIGALHSGFFGDLLVRAMAAVVVAAMLVITLWLSLKLTVDLLVRLDDQYDYVFHFFYPLALWAVAGFFCVVRFLGYLDLRIRREGWEVELLMRAEGARLKRRLT